MAAAKSGLKSRREDWCRRVRVFCVKSGIRGWVSGRWVRERAWMERV